ncbi:MAG: hypothetical protein WC415_05560 [Patescibacteria group bacterium]|jgi:hypothetical protein
MKDDGGLTKLEIAHSLAERIVERLASDSLGSLSDLKSFLAFFLVLVNEALRSDPFSDAGSLQKRLGRLRIKDKIDRDNEEINVVRAYATEIIKKLKPDDVWGLVTLKSVLEAELEKVESSMLVLIP